MTPNHEPTTRHARTSVRGWALGLALWAASACSSLETVRLQPETIELGPGVEPVAGIQASAISFYAFFLPVPGVDLDQVVNRMLVATAKTMGADKVVPLSFDIYPGGGVWSLARFLGWRTAHARGIAVKVVSPPPDAQADEGPEAPPTPTAGRPR